MILPTRALHGGSLQCPRCDDGSKLEEIDLTGAVIDICQRCSGLWMEPEELGVLARVGDDGVPPAFEFAVSAESVPGHRCPHCAKPMLRDRYARVSEVMIDVCTEHGVWLDAGQLHALRRFIAGGGAERTEKARRYLQQARRTFGDGGDPLQPFLSRWMTWRG